MRLSLVSTVWHRISDGGRLGIGFGGTATLKRSRVQLHPTTTAATTVVAAPALNARSYNFTSLLRAVRLQSSSTANRARSFPSTSFLTCSFSSRAILDMATERHTLPKTVKPTHYDLSVYNITLGAPWTYTGTVKITLDVKESVQEITLNAVQLKLLSAQVYTQAQKTEQALKASNFSYDEPSNRVTISFPSALPPSPSAVLEIVFEGTANDLMAGFYRSKYKPAAPAVASVPRDDQWHYMFSTQFESCDARRAFPCFDEPNLKATYDVELEIPEDQVALSNMPEKATRKGSKDGLKVVSFERTPIMSTYLLAWAFGDFEYVEAFTKKQYNGKNLPVRVYTTKGLKEQGRFALHNAYQIVDLFSEIFQIDYPLPKADLLAVHEFSHGAMENWGLVTYRTTAVLFDEANSDVAYKNRVAYVVAHELAHQWFGNLVTMDWWDELWLNEGFATWVGWLTLDKLYPEWNIWAQYVGDGMQIAYNLDSIRSSHPIQVAVRNALEVDQIFDAISYQKGSSTIRMLSAHLTQKVFLQGVADYLKKHAYSNATTDDLWSALSNASGQDVKGFIDPWVRKIGFPVLTVAEEPGQITVRQSRFLQSGDVKPEEDETIWWVPLGLKTGPQATATSATALTTKQDTVRNVDDSFYKLNADQTGLYRTNYPPERLIKLGEAKDKMTEADKCGLIGDAAALAISGDGHTTALLGLLEGFQSEQSFHVWSQILASLGNIRSTFNSNAKVSEGLKKFTLKLVTPVAEQVGWEFQPNEDFLTSQLRSTIIGAAGFAGHEAIINKAKQKFQDYFVKGDKSAIHPNLRVPVWRLGMSEGGEAEMKALQNEFLTTTSIDGRVIALRALGQVTTPEMIEAYFQFMLDEVKVQDVHMVSTSLGANSKSRLKFWELMKQRWQDVEKLCSNMPLILSRFIRVGLDQHSRKEVGEDIKAFFGKHTPEGCERAISIVLDKVEANAKYRERDEPLVLEWLEARGYI